ncbi:MAG: RidA family protein [Acidobacteriaceae bacterium]|nr:RidA family protein [Acidobacteriaceae bacterium]
MLLQAQKRKRKDEEPKTQVLPLPRELPMVLKADTRGLDFHVSPLLKTGGLSAQIHRSLTDLLRDTHGETIVKLRAFVSGAGDARRVGSEVSDLFTSRKQPLPVLTILQVGGLGEDLAQVIIEAIVSTPRTLNPNGLVFLSGQTGNSLSEALDRLGKSAKTASVAPEQIVSCTCFLSRLENGLRERETLQNTFPKAAVNVVQALRDPPNNINMCEAVGQLGSASTEAPLLLLKDARASIVRSPQLVFTGLQLTFGSYLDDAREAFNRLRRAASVAEAADSTVQLNAFSLDMTSGSALRKSTSAPPSTFTTQIVEGLPAMDASAGIEAVLVPDKNVK